MALHRLQESVSMLNSPKQETLAIVPVDDPDIFLTLTDELASKIKCDLNIISDIVTKEKMIEASEWYEDYQRLTNDFKTQYSIFHQIFLNEKEKKAHANESKVDVSEPKCLLIVSGNSDIDQDDERHIKQIENDLIEVRKNHIITASPLIVAHFEDIFVH